jgi:hypothetical protein
MEALHKVHLSISNQRILYDELKFGSFMLLGLSSLCLPCAFIDALEEFTIVFTRKKVHSDIADCN